MHQTKTKILLAVCLAISAAPVTTRAATFEKIFRFPSNGKDGRQPAGKLTFGPGGNFYGVTSAGGPDNGGTIFEVTPQGQLTTLHGFSGMADGAMPRGTVVFDASGNLYGTTSEGGALSGYSGTVYKLAPDGTETILHSFGGQGDGATPTAGLTYDGIGTFYGVTYYGGSGPGTGLGTIFSINLSGVETVLHSFNGKDGSSPDAPLFRDKDGNLFGTTYNGGKYGYGTVFELDATGKFRLLHSFGESQSDPQYPRSGLVLGRGGELYGTTMSGGTNGNGTVYSISRNGTANVIFSFGILTGDLPSDLIINSKNILYGSAEYGGTSGQDEGVAFKLTLTGKETLLHSFSGSDGAFPRGVTFDASGNLYGITSELNGFKHNEGVIFKIEP